MRPNFKLNFIFLTLICILSISVAHAQRGNVKNYASPLDPSSKSTPIYIGPAVGANILGHSMTLKTFSDSVLCPTFDGASGIGFYIGLTFEYLLGKDVANSNSSIIVRALYNTYPGSKTLDGDTYPSRNPQDESIIMSTVNHVLDIQYNVATLEVMYKLNPIPRFGLGVVVGPTFDFTISQHYKQTMNITDPDNAQFVDVPGYEYENYMRTRVIEDGEIPNAAGFRLGLKAGIQYELLLGSKFYIVPAVCYNFGITNLTGDYDWRVSPLQVGIDARYALSL